MYEVIIKMEVEDKADILKNIEMVKMEIRKGEMEFNNKGEVINSGYLPGKYCNAGDSTKFRIIDMNSPYYEYEKNSKKI